MGKIGCDESKTLFYILPFQNISILLCLRPECKQSITIGSPGDYREATTTPPPSYYHYIYLHFCLIPTFPNSRFPRPYNVHSTPQELDDGVCSLYVPSLFFNTNGTRLMPQQVQFLQSPPQQVRNTWDLRLSKVSLTWWGVWNGNGVETLSRYRADMDTGYVKIQRSRRPLLGGDVFKGRVPTIFPEGYRKCPLLAGVGLYILAHYTMWKPMKEVRTREQ